MNSNLMLLLTRHINTTITQIFIKNLYDFNLQFLNNLDLNIENYITFYYKGFIIIISIDCNNKEILNIMNTILKLKTINIYYKQQQIKHVFVINIDTKCFNNKENTFRIADINLKISSFTLKNNKIYEIIISSELYPQLITIKNMIDKYENK